MRVLLFPDFSREFVDFGDSSHATLPFAQLEEISAKRDGDLSIQPEGEGNDIMTARVLQRLDRRKRPRVRVYKVELSHSQGRHLAVCKVASFDEASNLLKEAALYDNELKTLQGTVVPTIKGLFMGWLDGEEAYVLVQEYCGPKSTNLSSFKEDVLAAAIKLHAAGVGIYENLLALGRHVTLADGADGSRPTIRFVGLDKAEPHQCALVAEGIPEPLDVMAIAYNQRPKCKELQALCLITETGSPWYCGVREWVMNS